MANKIVIDPVTRLEGHLKVEVSVDLKGGSQQVIDAKVSGTLYRGFEKLLVGRHPLDSQHVTQRICGVCPVSHSLAAVMALDKAFGVGVPDNARIMRNLVLGSNYIQSHVLHFYHLTLPDFVKGPNMPPWQPSWATDRRFDAGATTTLVNNYLKALDIRRKAHEMGAIFGGRMPHPPTYLPGGFTEVPSSAQISKFKTYLSEIINFINTVYLPDIEKIAALYSDYYQIGTGPKNLLAYGVFDLDAAGKTRLLKRGMAMNGSPSIQPVDVSYISEHVKYSWYADGTDGLNPDAGVTTAQYPKTGAYSWLKAPRYLGNAVEVGPLARMWVNGDYRRGISALDRHRARAYETKKVATAMQTWVNQIVVGKPVFNQFSIPPVAEATGLTEAPRGALGHWVEINGGKLSRYQIITPTCWNASPRDKTGMLGPIEQALIGTPVENVNEPVEVMRVIHSFDPCLSCAVHVVSLNEGTQWVVSESCPL
ncbi:MAG: nickel-dependent hydrogenase large subunit [Thermodesulfovibrionales bacterium]|nr:nickel-dependent hydrogenase large subunit [Thermodesulfovibrionales bacterium]